MAYPTVLYSADGEQYNTYRDDGTTNSYPFATQLVLQDGRKFRYTRAGGTLLVVGDVQQAAVNTTNHIGLTAIASALGSRAPTATLGATAATVNDYREGYVQVTTTPDGGSMYVIGQHDAVLSAGVITLNLAPGFALKNAWTTSTRVGLVHNAYKNVVQLPVTTLTQVPVGVAVTALAANTSVTALSRGWLATSGPASVNTTGTLVIGQRAVASTAAAGAVAPGTGTIATYIVEQEVGNVMLVSTTFSLVRLTIDK